MPSPGPLKRFALPPAGEGLRIDTGVREGDQISFHYDPMIAKIVSQGQDRDAAIARMLAALGAGRRRGGRHQCGFLGACSITRPSGPGTSTRALRPSMPASC
jgi:Acetyl/propionyl-CoA carboxylase, alpha subunit